MIERSSGCLAFQRTCGWCEQGSDAVKYIRELCTERFSGRLHRDAPVIAQKSLTSQGCIREDIATRGGTADMFICPLLLKERRAFVL